MKVGELIEELQKHDPSKEVRLLTYATVDEEHKVGGEIEYFERVQEVGGWNDYITIE